MTHKIVTAVAVACLGATSLFADFSYEQTSKITGGAMAGMMRFAGAFSKQAREPMQTTIVLKGDRMARISANHAQIIDLARETITEIDFQRKQYSVMTFEQMKQMLDEMSQRMKNGQQGQDVKFNVSAKNTGQTRQISGFGTHEVIVTMEMQGQDAQNGQKSSMVVTDDMWLAPDISGYREVREYHKRMAKKINWAPGGMPMMGGQAGMAKGMAEAYKTMAEADGVPVLAIVSISGTGQGNPQAGAPPAQNQQTEQQAPPANEGLAGALGRFGGFGRRKKQTDQQQASQNAGAPGSLMETTMEMTGFSSAPVDASKFEVPEGFKQVDYQRPGRGAR